MGWRERKREREIRNGWEREMVDGERKRERGIRNQREERKKKEVVEIGLVLGNYCSGESVRGRGRELGMRR